MALRFYLGTGAAAAISPAVDASWERSIAGFARYKLSTTKDNSALADVAALFGSTSTSETCWLQLVSDPLAAQTIAGTFDGLIRCQELSASEDAYLVYALRVVSNDGTTVRGTLKVGTNTTREINAATATGRGPIPAPTTLSSVALLAGDRIVLELGVHGITPANLVNVILRIGAPSDVVDISSEGSGSDRVPWFEFSQNLVFADPPVGEDADLLVFGTRPLAVERVELWTDVELNGGSRIAPIASLFTLAETKRLDGEHTLSFSVPLDHPIIRLRDTPVGQTNLRVDQVVRLLWSDGDYTEHRISETTRRNRRGQRTREIVARSILQDLGFRGIITRTTADGASTATFEALGLTMAQNIETHILPTPVEAGQDFWAVGTMTHLNPVDMVYGGDSPLSALRSLAAVGGDLELAVERRPFEYAIHLLRQVGAGVEPLVVRARKNLLDLGFSERDADQATRVYAFGQDTDGVRPSLGQATWDAEESNNITGGYEFTVSDPSSGARAIAYDGQFLPVREGDPRYHLEWVTGADFIAPIVATTASNQLIQIETTAIPPAGVNRVRIVADAGGRENLFVDHPAMVQTYGVRAAKFYRDDIPATDNLVPNPYGRVWPVTSPFPTGWSVPGPFPEQIPVVTRETNPRYWQHGGQAVRVEWDPAIHSAGDLSRVGLPIATIPLRAQGYLSWFVRVTTLRGSIQTWIKLTRRATDYDGNPSPSLPFLAGTGLEYWIPQQTGTFENDIVLPIVKNIELNTAEEIGVAAAWDLGKYPLYGGTAEIFVANDYDTGYGGNWALSDGAACIIEAAQLTISPSQMPLLEGNGGNRLHQAANERVGLYGAPAPAVTVSAVDLGLAREARLTLGGPIQIQDPETDVAVSTRIVGWDRDLFHHREPQYELSNQRADITTLLSKLSRTTRHRTATVPPGTRGLSYAPV